MKVYITILIIALGTYLTRVLPFLFLRDHDLSPKALKIIDALPYATISLLVVYSFKDTTSANLLPTLFATLVCVGTYIWKDNMILSTVSSTLTYMILLSVF